jgi:crotonobetainyl-CoA:carnitine CoA-transferase CaiB-like acyl-CoA transferase
LISPVRVGGTDEVTYRRAPLRNEHADEILRELLGYSPSTIATLTDGGAFGG